MRGQSRIAPRVLVAIFLAVVVFASGRGQIIAPSPTTKLENVTRPEHTLRAHFIVSGAGPLATVDIPQGEQSPAFLGKTRPRLIANGRFQRWSGKDYLIFVATTGDRADSSGQGG